MEVNKSKHFGEFGYQVNEENSGYVNKGSVCSKRGSLDVSFTSINCKSEIE